MFKYLNLPVLAALLMCDYSASPEELSGKSSESPALAG